MPAAQALSLSLALLQSGRNSFLKKAHTSLRRLSGSLQRWGEEKTPVWMKTLAVLELQPLGSLLCLALDLALARSLEALVHGFSLAALKLTSGTSKTPHCLSLTVAACQHLRRCLRTGHKCRGVSQMLFQPFTGQIINSLGPVLLQQDPSQF